MTTSGPAVPPEKVFAVHSPGNGISLPEHCRALIAQQQEAWDQLRRGIDSLEGVRTRDLKCAGFTAFLQFNPKRITSTGARVDPKTIQTRPCFLCIENLPAPQKGILYREEFLVLCNPMPIFPHHFTIANIRHVPQNLEENIESFLRLAVDLSPAYSVFYNGPQCGASAPDHMHFQAGPLGAIPVEKDVMAATRGPSRMTKRGVTCFSLTGYGREVVVLESDNIDGLADAVRSLLAAFRSAVPEPGEPKVNIIATYGSWRWRVIVFLRSKHRPGVYFLQGDEQIMISPAAVDIGGLIVTPIQRDFERVDERLLESIYREVSVGPEVTRRVLDMMMETA